MKGHPLAQNMVGCWLFNEGGGGTALDSSGLGNHGTLTNFAFTSSSGWTVGKSGPALYFDGINDYVLVPAKSCFDLENIISVEVLVYLYTFENSAQDDLVIYVRQGQLEIWFSPVTHKCCMMVPDGTYFCSSALNTHKWYHCVLVWNKNESPKGRIYINGVLDGSGSPSDIGTGSGNPIYIGRYYGYTGENQFIGKAEFVRVYNRALSPQEVQQLYLDPYCMFSRPIHPELLYAPYEAPSYVPYPHLSGRAGGISEALAGGVGR